MDLFNKNGLLLIYIISFMDLFAVGLTFPVLAPYIRSIGASPITVGIISSLYSLLQVLSGPIIGSWSDVRGKKSVFIITLLLCSVFYFLLGFSTSIYSIIILRVLLGISKHTQSINKAIVADLVPDADTSKVYGKCAAYGALGFVIGPVIGGHLSEYKSGFTYICSLTSILFLINIAMVSLLPDSKKPKKIDNGFILKSFRKEIVNATKDLRKVQWNIHWFSFLLKFLFTLSITTYYANQSMYLKENFNVSQKYVGYTISYVSIIGVVAAFLLGAITNKFYKNDTNSIKRCLHSFAALTCCFMGVYFAPNYYLLLIYLIPFGVCNSILRIVTMEMIFKRAGDNEKGSLSGASDSVASLARFVAPIIAGFVSDKLSENAVMIFAFIPCAIGTVVCYVKYSDNNIKHKPS